MSQDTAMPLQGAAVGSIAHHNASGDLSGDTEHPSAARVLQGPAAFESDGTAVRCLQDAKVGRCISLSCLLVHHSETCFAVSTRVLLQHIKKLAVAIFTHPSA